VYWADFMAYSIFVGKQRSLVFPVMCNGFLTIDYSKNIVDSSADITYGLWDLTGDFTFECIFTPYEINGFGTHSSNGDLYAPTSSVNGNLRKENHTDGNGYVSNSKKINSGLEQSIYDASTENDHESELYLSRNNRYSHEMRIFHSSDLQISLLNNTLHNENSPARYKLKVGIKLGTDPMEYFTSDEIIYPNWGFQYNYNSGNDIRTYDSTNKTKYRQLGIITSVSGSTIGLAGASNYLFGGDKIEVFTKQGKDFISLGTVNQANASDIVLTSTPSITLTTSDFIFVKAEQEPNYINNLYHIACTYSEQNKSISLFFNGNKILQQKYSGSGSFSLAEEDFYIGANGTGSTGAGSAQTNNQFMGELHELAILNIKKNEFNGVSNLLPNYDNTVLYLRFEEVDL